MRQPATTALQALISAVPDDRLRELVLTLMLNGVSTAAATPAIATPAPPAKGTRRGWPRGQRKPAAANAAHRAALDKRNARLRVAREAARAAQAKPAGANGNGSTAGDGSGISPEAVWAHAAKLSPKAPWKALREVGVNEALALDAHRNSRLPPGFGPAEAAKFLELPAG